MANSRILRSLTGADKQLQMPQKSFPNMPATIMPVKIHGTHNFKTLAAATALILFWVVGLGLPRRADDADLIAALSSSKLDPSSSTHPEKGYASTGDLELNPVDADALCAHYHLKVHNTTNTGKDGKPKPKPPRKIYDLLLITPDTSIDALELHLAQTSPFVDYFILLESPPISDLVPHPDPPEEPEWWERDGSKVEATEPNTTPFTTATLTDTLSFLEQVWESRLYPYHDKIIRRTLSQFSSDFAPDKDHEAAAHNAVYTQVVPFLMGTQKAEIGDVLIVSDVVEVMRPLIFQVLRNCEIPKITTVRTKKYWYSFQWTRMDMVETSPTEEAPPEEMFSPGLAKRSEHGVKIGLSNEQWSHPQVTTYQGTETLMPHDLRKDRNKDEYVFADGGWTCKLCYSSITETLAKAGEMGLIWHDGPRWKAAGRTVDRMMRGIDLFDQIRLSRVESNPDIPSYLRNNPYRFPWMLNRDPHGANFIDFNEAEFQQYLAKKKEVDAEKDTEKGTSPHVWNLATTQAWNDPDFAPTEEELAAGFRLFTPWLHGEDWTDEEKRPPPPEMSEEDKAFLNKIKDKPDTELNPEEIAILNQLAEGGGPPLVYGED